MTLEPTKAPAPKRHHRVPEFYLQQFAKREPREEIWTYDIEMNTARAGTVENAAVEGYLYSYTLADGTRVNDFEEQIAKIESAAAPALVKLLKGEKLTDEQRLAFASFIAIMYVRTDAFRLQFAELTMGGLQLQNYATALDDKTFRSSMEAYQKNTGKTLSAKEMEDLRDSMLHPEKFKVSVDKEWTLQALGFHDHLVPIFAQMNWAVLSVDAARYLITTDNPVVFAVPEQHQHPFYRGGLMHQKVELTFPLSSSSCLFAAWQDLPSRIKVERETVKWLNRIRAAYARRFIFAPIMDDGIANLGQKYKDVHPGMRTSGFGPEKYSPVDLHRHAVKKK